jgi:hypothetical protein
MWTGCVRVIGTRRFFMPEPRLVDEQIESMLLFERMVLGVRI